MKNKLMMMVISLSLTLGVLGGVATYLFVIKDDANVQAAATQLSAKDLAEFTVNGGGAAGSIVTNLHSPHFIVINYSLVGENEDVKVELEGKLDLVKSLYISTLSGMKAEDLKGPEKLKAFEENMKVKVNEVLVEGQVVDILTTDLKIQDAR